MDYYKIGRASELAGRDYKIYRALEIFPGFLSWLTLLGLIVLSYFYPVFVAFFIIAFDIYWLLLVAYLGIHLIAAYRQMKMNARIDWREKCRSLPAADITASGIGSYLDVMHLIILPMYREDLAIIRPTIQALADCGYPRDKMMIVLAVEERGGEDALANAQKTAQEFAGSFRNFIISVHPDGLPGEIKGKGANQTWAAKEADRQIIVKEGLDKSRIMVSVFDIDTVIYPQYFYCLTYKFLTAANPYRASYQPVPVYHNNIWQAPFFSRVAANSNTFWQMMQQIRQDKLATYSSHSMTWLALEEIGFWSTTMVSEDSRIFWHCFCYYNGDYRVEPLYYPVSMDVCMDTSMLATAKNLYKQQRRWGWGVENLPYLMFNTIKQWKTIPKKLFVSRILVQLYGFHSWATNALIIAIIGWMPLILGGDKFIHTVLSTNLPFITRTLMTFAMSGLILSAILSTLLLPPKPKKYGLGKYLIMLVQWAILPATIIIFGSLPGLEAQTRLMLGKYLGFWVTPKTRAK